MLTRKLSPVLHSIKTLPSMLLETMHIPQHRIRQESDWKKLCDRFPGLDQYAREEGTLQGMLRPAYSDYVSHFSASLISLSLNRASFLLFFVKLIGAKHILDLGSGFSSFVFRLSVQQAGRGNVASVDDSESWLMETKRFLEKYNLDTGQLYTLNQYYEGNSNSPVIDLCFLDLGDIELRQKLLPDLLSQVQQNQLILIVDDFHIPAYRGFITALCAEKEVNIYSLRKVTRRRLSHMAMIIK